MAVNQIPYFIYTSGERGLSDLDWAVKFASPELDKEKLFEEYKKINTRFGIDLSSEREKSESLGILVLPKWIDDITPFYKGGSQALPDRGILKGYSLIGFAYPSKDLRKRKNISFIGCIVSDEVKNKCSISDFIKYISEQNNLVEIACLNKEKIDSVQRPDYLTLVFVQTNTNDNHTNQTPKQSQLDYLLLNNLSWQTENKGYWIKDNNLTELTLKEVEKTSQISNKNEPQPKGGKTVKNTLIGFIIIIAILISSAIAAYFIGLTNRFFPDNPKEPAKITEQPKTSKIAPLEQIKNTIVLNISNYSNSRKNEILVGIGLLRVRKGDEYEIDNFSTTISDLKNLSSFKCEMEIKYDIVCTEKELEKAICNIILSNSKEFSKSKKDDFFKDDYSIEPYKVINSALKEKFNNNFGATKSNNNYFNDIKIKEYIRNYFDLLSPNEKENIINKFQEQNYVYMPNNFTKFVLIFKKNDYVYNVVEYDGINFSNSKGEFFYSNDNGYYKLPSVIPNDESKNFYIKRDGNYYKFGKIDKTLTQSDKDKIFKDFSHKYYKHILEKNK